MSDQFTPLEALGAPPERPIDVGRSRSGALGAFFSNRLAAAALGLLLIIAGAGLVGPLLLPVGPFEMVGAPFTAPGDGAILGTDYLGRDVLVGIVYGTRPTLTIGLAASIFASAIGLTLGALAGFYGGWVDSLVMRVTEFFQILPSLVFAMVLVTLFRPSLAIVIFAISVVSWIPITRLTRAEFSKIKQLDYVRAARAIGARDARIIWRVIVPNALPPLIVASTLMIGTAILFAAALGFLGLSDPQVETWGMMIGESRSYFRDAWWTVTFPGLAIVITVLSVALVGDGLNDALDPRSRGR